MKTKSRTTTLWLAGLVVVVALGFLLFRGLGEATVYFRTADEAVAQRESLGSRRFRIEGTVVPGSVQSSKSDVTFRIAGRTTQVAVVHEGDPPELFKPGVPVVLEGHFSGDHFASDRIMVKHSESYVAEHPERVTTVPTPSP